MQLLQGDAVEAGAVGIFPDPAAFAGLGDPDRDEQYYQRGDQSRRKRAGNHFVQPSDRAYFYHPERRDKLSGDEGICQRQQKH